MAFTRTPWLPRCWLESALRKKCLWPSRQRWIFAVLRKFEPSRAAFFLRECWDKLQSGTSTSSAVKGLILIVKERAEKKVSSRRQFYSRRWNKVCSWRGGEARDTGRITLTIARQRASLVEVPRDSCEEMDKGMHTPMIHMKHGNTKSPT